jgi:predicted PurR-regulated permease PerM
VTRLLGGRDNLAAAVCSLALAAVLVVPCVLLTGTLVQGVASLASHIQDGRLDLALPPAVAKVPVVGPKLEARWNAVSVNLPQAVERVMPQIKSSAPALLTASAGIGGVLLQILIAIVLGGFLLAKSDGSARFADQVFRRIFGERGQEFEDVVASTVRSVTNGIVGVAVIQTLFASLGFWLVGLPGAGLWAIVFLIAAVLQVGALVMIPAVVFAFSITSTTYAVVFLCWCIVVGLMDNVLKPILLGRGSKVPMLVVFLGVLGGFASMNIIGLFVGAVVLSVGYMLFMAWLGNGVGEAKPVEEEERAVTV